MKHVKYFIINIIPILVFFGIWGLLYYFIENSTLLEAVFYVFPFVYYAIVAIIDVNKNKEISQFGRDTRIFYFIISAIVIIIGIITTIYWFVTGKTDFASTSWISWEYNYVWNFIFYLLPSILILIIGLSANVYIWLISYVFLKIKSKLKTTK